MADTSPPKKRRKRAEISARPRSRRDAVGSLFRFAREAQGLSQEQVAELTGGNPGEVSRSTVGDIERGRIFPNLESLIALSRVLHLDPSEILERVDLSAVVPVDLTGLGYEELARRAREYYWSRDLRSALAVYDAMLEQLLLDPPEGESERVRRHARIEINRAVTLRQCSALKAAEASAKRAVDLSSSFQELQSEAYMVLASIHSHEGLLVLALDTIERAVLLAEGGSSRLKGQTLSQKGNVLYRVERYTEARDVFMEARKFAIDAGDPYTAIGVEGNIGSCLVALRRPSQARRWFTKALELARKHGDRAFEASWLVELGELALAGGELDEAEEKARDALRVGRNVARVLTEFRAEWLRYRIAQARNPKGGNPRLSTRLRKLHARVKDHRGLSVIREFEAAIIDRTRGGV